MNRKKRVQICLALALSSNLIINSAFANTGGANIPSLIGGLAAYVGIHKIDGTDADNANVKINLDLGTTILGSHLIGGYSTTGFATGNQITATGAKIYGNTYGGYVLTGTGHATNNKVNFTNGAKVNYVYGGYVGVTGSGNATGNSVSLTVGATADLVHGGYAQGTGRAIGNNVDATDSTVNNYVFGGYAAGIGNATGNSVGVTNSTIGNIVAGFSSAGNATDNTLNITGGTVDNVHGGSAAAGTAANNSVVMKGGTVNGYIGGGYVSSIGSATGNKVSLTNGAKVENIYGGYVVAGAGEATNNSVDVADGVIGTVKAGYSSEGNVNTNTVHIADSNITGNVYGGHVLGGSGTATGNITSITNSTANNYVFGGYVGGTGDVKGNIADVTGSTIGNLFAGYSNAGNATDNTLNITGGNASIVHGGSAAAGTATNNNINMQNGTVTDKLYGGYVGSIGAAIGNTVSIANSAKVENLYSGYVVAGTGDAKSNRVSITTGAEAKNLYGGYILTGTGNATDNSIRLTAGAKADIIHGGYVTGAGDAINNSIDVADGTIGTIKAGYSGTGNANANTINITDSNITDSVYVGHVLGGAGTATGNSTNITGSTVNNYVFGAYVGGTGDATDNSVDITNSTIGNIVAGYSSAGNATGNSVIATNITVDNIYGGNTDTGSISNNTVVITGGNIGYDVGGGYITTGTGTATNNTVTILGNPTFGVTSIIHGGDTKDVGGTTGDIRTGNTLNFFSNGVTVKNIDSFENYNFLIPTDGSIGLTLTANITDFGTNPKITAPYVQAGGKLNAGDTVVVVKGDVLNNIPRGEISSGKAQQGVSLIYDYILTKDVNKIIATINGTKLNPANEIFAENRISKIGFINSGTDALINLGIPNAVNSAKQGGEMFAGSNFGNTRYKSGSNIDASGTNLFTGLAYKLGTTTVGYFIEGGWSSYDTVTESVNNGHANYYGLGMLVKKQLKKGYYLDSSLRLGQIQSGYVNKDLKDAIGNSASYHSKSFYYSAHLGVGKIYNLSEKQKLDVFLRYLFSHQNGNNINIFGDTFNFKAINSNRLQLGTKYTFNKTAKTNYYLGLTYEYEMSGIARSTVYGFDIPSPSIKGSTGIMELGVQINADNKTTIEIGLQGCIGKRQGFSGSISANFKL